MIKPLEYYYTDGSHVIFNKYTIDENGVVRNKKGKMLASHKVGKYNRCTVCDKEKPRMICIGRAIASTFCGAPPTTDHTADHIDRNSTNDRVENIRWLCKSGQVNNRIMPETQKTVFIVVNDGVEKTAREWVETIPKYTIEMIQKYARQKQHGFSYKEYPDLSGEVWKEIEWTKTTRGYWKISNMNRVKYVTKYAENVLSGERIGLMSGYPIIMINGKQHMCHILSFMTFFPEEYSFKKPDEMILHEGDDKLDFRPQKLRLGTQHINRTDAHNNGCYDDTKRERQRCSSYIGGVFEKVHESQMDAMRYLISLGYDKASVCGICMVLSNKRKTAYDRTWIRVIT